MAIIRRKLGLQVTDLIALIITITIQIIIQSIWVSKTNYLYHIGFNWLTFKNLISPPDRINTPKKSNTFLSVEVSENIRLNYNINHSLIDIDDFFRRAVFYELFNFF